MAFELMFPPKFICINGVWFSSYIVGSLYSKLLDIRITERREGNWIGVAYKLINSNKLSFNFLIFEKFDLIECSPAKPSRFGV